MTSLGEIVRRLRGLLDRRRLERDIEDEMHLHVELRQSQLEGAGLDPDAARLAARRRFGNVVRLREDSVDAWGWRWLAQLTQDVRFGARTLVRNPGFAATAIVSLALATGATTAIFSIVNGVLLRPLPFADPDRLVQVYGRAWSEDRNGVPDPLTGGVASPELESYVTQSTTFDGFTAYALTTRHLDSATGAERLTAVMADTGFFAVLGVDALAGRTFRADDGPDVAVISAGLWESHFASDPSLPGRAITLDGRTFTVVGVMPPWFQFPYGAGSMMPGALPESRTDMWVPLEPLRSSSGALRRGRITVTGRLKPGVMPGAAQAELRAIAARVEAQAPAPRRIGVRLEPLADVVVGPVRQSLWMLFAAVGLVLAAACANVANLLLARMTVRMREVVTRVALGANPLRLVRQFLAESLLLSLAGGLAGVLIAQWLTRFLVSLGSAKIPRAHEIALDWRVFAFLFGACIATAVLFGLAPALTAARVDAHEVTRSAGGHASMGRRYGRIRDGLVILEVALAFVLAVGAVAIVREVARLQRVDPGMSTENVLALHLTPRAPAQDYYAIEHRVAQLPGVQAAGFTQLVPLQNWGWTADLGIRGRPRTDASPRVVVSLRYVTPGYFSTLRIPVMLGRTFTAQDIAGAPSVIVVNESLARRYFPNENPIGLETDRGTIVGVVRDVRNVGLDRPAEPELFYPAAQNVTMAPDIGMSLLVRMTTGIAPQTAQIRAAVRDVNPALAVFNVRTMEQVRADSLWELNLYRWLIGVFAWLALTLAAIGMYGVISYNITSRMREFAVRLALGAHPAALARLVLRRAMRLAGAGLVGGIAAALAAAPLLRHIQAGIDTGPATYAAVSVLLLVIAAAACLLPAIRVAILNPAIALRHE